MQRKHDIFPDFADFKRFLGESTVNEAINYTRFISVYEYTYTTLGDLRFMVFAAQQQTDVRFIALGDHSRASV
jgi:hypothetical protein